VPGTGPFGPEDRPMGGYVTLPGDWTADEAGPWVAEALAAAGELPPKVPKAKRPSGQGVSHSPRVRDLVAGPQLDSEASRQHSIATRDHVTSPRTF
jgi:hypothetical protein